MPGFLGHTFFCGAAAPAVPSSDESHGEVRRILLAANSIWCSANSTQCDYGSHHKIQRCGNSRSELDCFVHQVVDTKTGEEMAPDEDGEILAKGPQMMKGYLGNPDATAKTIDKDGWFHTGDIGHFDKDGMLYIVDRLKEMIKYKGFQIAPAELESVLLSHPEISDAAVIGVPEKDAGEVPKAFVVKKSSSLTEETVKNFVAKELSHYKHLKGGVEFINAIPKSASGKILRRELRK